MRLLLNTKVNPEGSFQKAKARSVLPGDRMMKGLHYSVVFCASPTLAASKILRRMIVRENLSPFAADIDQAFTAADSQEEEKIAVRMADG